MSTFKQYQFKIEDEDKAKAEVNITPLVGDEKLSIKELELGDLKQPTSYREAKEKYGVLAATDVTRTEAKNQKFHLNAIIKKTLSIEGEEQRFIEERVKKRIDELSDKVKSQAQKEGFEEGFKAGSEEGLKQQKVASEKVLSQLEDILSGFDNIKAEMYKANERFLMDVIFKIAKMIIRKELAIDKEYLMRLVQEMISLVDEKEHITLLISAEDQQIVSSLEESLMHKFVEIKNFRIEVSHHVKSGDCQIMTDWYLLNANLEIQLQRIYEAFFGNR